MEPISKEYRAQFANGARLASAEGVYKTQEEWERKGLLNLKRRVLGVFGRKSVKSIDELANILTEIKVVDSTDRGIKFVRGLYEKEADYGFGTLEFKKTLDKREQEGCRITRHFNSPMDYSDY